MFISGQLPRARLPCGTATTAELACFYPVHLLDYFFLSLFVLSPLTVHALTQNTMRNLEPLGKKKCYTRVRRVVVGNSTKLQLTSSLILFKQ